MSPQTKSTKHRQSVPLDTTQKALAEKIANACHISLAAVLRMAAEKGLPEIAKRFGIA